MRFNGVRLVRRNVVEFRAREICFLGSGGGWVGEVYFFAMIGSVRWKGVF